MLFIAFIILWLAVAALWLLMTKFRNDRRIGRRWYDFGDFQLPVVALIILLLSYILISLVRPIPRFQNNAQQIEYGKKTRQPWLITNALWSCIANDPLNASLHYQLIQNHFLQQHEKPPSERAWNQEGVRLFSLYTNWSRQTDDLQKADLGNLFLAWWYILREPEDHTNAQFHLRQVENENHPYLNLAIGQMMQDGIGDMIAAPYYQQEIDLKGAVEEATAALALCNDRSGDYMAVRNVVLDSATRNWIDPELRYEVYFRENDPIQFYALHFKQFGTTLSLWGLAGGLLILFVWLIFLKRLSYLAPIHWNGLIFTALLGAVLAMGTWWLYAFSRYSLQMGLNGKPLNDLLFCIIGIGGIEEFVKLIAFLLVIRFTHLAKKPVDYMIIASATGLGFAFFENLLYVSRYGLDVLHARAVTASVAHMMAGALVAYGFVLARRYQPYRWWLIPLFFIGAMVAHGFYDFWLVNKVLPGMSLITLIFFLVLILIYVICLNNALNQTATASSPPFSTRKLTAFLAGALILVFVLEYISVSVVYGYVIGNRTVTTSFLSGGYLIFFLSVHLSNITIVPGAWYPLRFLNTIFPGMHGFGGRRGELPFERGEQLYIQTSQGEQFTGTVQRYMSRQTANDTVQVFLLNNPLIKDGIGYPEVWISFPQNDSEWLDVLVLDIFDSAETQLRKIDSAQLISPTSSEELTIPSVS